MNNYIIEKNVKIGKNVSIGFGSIIKPNTTIGDNAKIGEYCIIGEQGSEKSFELFIGENSVIRSHSIIYSGSYFKEGLVTGHHSLIREKTIAGKSLTVGSFSDIEGNVEIGDYCKFHSYSHIGIGSKIGNYVKIYSLVTLTNDPLPPSNIVSPVTLKDGVVISVGSTILPGTILNEGVFVSANSVVQGDIPIGSVVKGENSKIIGKVNSLINFENMIRHPWMNHFLNNYPKNEHTKIIKLKNKIMLGIKGNKNDK